MYTIKQASLRTGVGIPLLRAWERRYGIPKPARTPSRYRLYDDAALDAIRQMQSLVRAGWSPSQAAQAILDGRAPATAAMPPIAETREAATLETPREEEDADGQALAGGIPIETGEASLAGYPIERLLGGAAAGRKFQGRPRAGRELLRRFVAAARTLDEPALESVLDEAFAGFGVEMAVSSVVLPALAAVGEGWTSGLLDVAAEHAATNVAMRRLGSLYEAAAQPSAAPQVIVGLPPGGRHEVGALAFALACRRAGIGVLYLGADVPLESWRLVAREHPRAAVVLGAVTEDEGRQAAGVAKSLRADRANVLLAIGGAGAPVPAPDGVALLASTMPANVETLRHLLRA